MALVLTAREKLGTPSARLECNRCVLTAEDDSELTIDEEGVCNHCRRYDREISVFPHAAVDRERKLDQMVARVKMVGAGNRYDCIIGVSGGVDSTWLALRTKELGLRPIAVHFDNGWNSELAVKNIESIISRLGIDLSTYVVDWEEFKDLQLAYLKASVRDIEVPTDHGIYGVLYRAALKHRVKYILSGINIQTEGVLPYSWIYKKLDYVNLVDIHRRFGSRPLKSYPIVNLRLRRRVRRAQIETLEPMNLMEYDKVEAKHRIQMTLAWRDYGGKHYESIFTRFYQGYILPAKFGIDKRKAHLSTLICSGQLTKVEALRELETDPYDPVQLREDKEFVLKKLGLSHTEFDDIISLPVRRHQDFKVEGSFFNYFPLLQSLRPVWKAVRPLFR